MPADIVMGPDCPECKTRGVGVPIEVAEGRFYVPSDGREPRVFCPCCAASWHGSEADVWKAARSEAAYQRRERQEAAQAKESAQDRERREKLARAMRGEW